MKSKFAAATFATLAIASAYAADDVVNSMLKTYESQGASRFSASHAETMWNQVFVDPKTGDKRRCSLCHTDDLRRSGKHAVTGKIIEPLAPSANPKRLTDPEHIEKWFLRNCKWTLGRECTPQEKGDFLAFLRTK